MTRCRLLAAAVLALGAACGQPPAQTAPEPPPESNRAEPAANEAAPPPEAPDESGLADMSPRQRQAYERGFADCQAGRYAPDNFPEAYRIGCAAAQER